MKTIEKILNNEIAFYKNKQNKYQEKINKLDKAIENNKERLRCGNLEEMKLSFTTNCCFDGVWATCFNCLEDIIEWGNNEFHFKEEVTDNTLCQECFFELSGCRDEFLEIKSDQRKWGQRYPVQNNHVIHPKSEEDNKFEVEPGVFDFSLSK